MARVPSVAAHKKVLRATLELVAERGIDATSMDAVSQRSGVSKATIYKHWADKDALILEMMADFAGLRDRPKFDTGKTRRDMIDVLSYHPPQDPVIRQKIMPHFMVYAATREEFGNSWRNMATDPPRKELTHLIRKGIQKKELKPGINIQLALAMLLGPALYWHIFLKKSFTDARPLSEFVVDAFWSRFAVNSDSIVAQIALPDGLPGHQVLGVRGMRL